MIFRRKKKHNVYDEKCPNYFCGLHWNPYMELGYMRFGAVYDYFSLYVCCCGEIWLYGKESRTCYEIRKSEEKDVIYEKQEDVINQYLSEVNENIDIE